MMQDILLILNIFILESMLSVDNASALCLLVRNLPEGQQSKALKYGIVGAFVFRGILLLIAYLALYYRATWMPDLRWLPLLASLWLIWIAVAHFTRRVDSIEEIKESRYGFWGTVLLVELMDIAFSADNIFAAVAMSNKLWIVLVGVFLGIIAMRFVAVWFIKLIKIFPSLETSAFVVIFLLGIKLASTAILSYIPEEKDVLDILSSNTTSFWFSGVMMLIFFGPLPFHHKKQ